MMPRQAKKSHRFSWEDFKAFSRLTLPLWRDLDPELMAAGLSYFALFSLAPLLFVVLTVASHFISQPAAQQMILDRASLWMTDDAADMLDAWINTPLSRHTHSAAFFSLIVAAITGSQVLGYMKRILNRIWHVRPRKKDAAWKTWMYSWFFNLLMLMVLGLFLSMSLLMDASAGMVWKFFRDILPENLLRSASWLQGLNFAVSLFFFCLLFGMIYRFVPDAPMEWEDVWAGALVTSILLAIGKVVLSLYLSLATFASAFGAASSLVILLFSIYVGSNIFIFGGVFTRAYAEFYGSRKKAASAS
jgi:membrane protein